MSFTPASSFCAYVFGFLLPLQLSSRYLRARKFDVQGAIGQFTDTEKWMKEQHVVELYDHFDVDVYEKARLMVSSPFNHVPPPPGSLC